MEDKMIQILALIQAIYNTAKRYHWMYHGEEFYQWHLFFDRIADTISTDNIDKLAEQYYMGAGHDKANEINEFDKLVDEYAGGKFDYFYSTDASTAINMCSELYNMVARLKSMVQDNGYDQGIHATLDEVASQCDVALALLDSSIDKTGSQQGSASTPAILVIGESVEAGRMHDVLGIPEDEKVSDVYKSGESLAKDLEAQVGREDAMKMLVFAGNMNKGDDVFDKAREYLKKQDAKKESLPVDWRSARMKGRDEGRADKERGVNASDEDLKQLCIYTDDISIDEYIKGYHEGQKESTKKESKDEYTQGYELGYDDGDYGIVRDEKELRELVPHYSDEQFRSYVNGYNSGLGDYEDRYNSGDEWN